MSQKDQEYQLTEKGKELADNLAQMNIEKEKLFGEIVDEIVKSDGEPTLTSTKLKADLKELNKKIAEAKTLEEQKQKEVKEKSKSKKESVSEEEPEEQEAGAKDGQMGYREAKNIRKSSFGTLLGEQEGGLGTSLKKVMSLKAKAKMTGIRETFDPMNIAKKLTFGSNLAPAIVGKMFGRKQEDIAHFTDGKVRGKDTSSKLKPIDKESGQDGMVDILTKILTLLQQSNENEIKSKEKQNNLSEEGELEKEKKRKELLLALQGKDKDAKDGKPTATKAAGSNIIDTILNMFGLGAGAANMLSLLAKLGPLLINPVTLLLLAAVAGGYALKWLFDNSDPEKINELNAGKGPYGTLVAGMGAETQLPSVEDEQADKANSTKASAVDKKGISNASLEELEAKRQQLIDYGDPRAFVKAGNATKAQATKAKQLDDIEAAIAAKKQSATPAATSAPTAAPVAATSAPTAAPVADSSSSGSSAPKASLSPNETVVPTADPVASANVGQKLNQAVAENNSAKLENSSSGAETSSSTINNTTNLASKSSDKNKNPILGVRNSEDTFQRMLMGSIRTV